PPPQFYPLSLHALFRSVVEGGRRAIGWIGHQPQLYAQLTVRENLRFWASLYDVHPPSDRGPARAQSPRVARGRATGRAPADPRADRKSTRLNSSHDQIS